MALPLDFESTEALASRCLLPFHRMMAASGDQNIYLELNQINQIELKMTIRSTFKNIRLISLLVPQVAEMKKNKALSTLQLNH